MTSVQQKTDGSEVTYHNPMSDVLGWNTRIGQLFDSVWQAAAHPNDRVPGCEIEESDEAFTIDLDVPGMSKKDIEVEVAGRQVIISGTRMERERSGVLRHTTRVSGAFRYELSLPALVNEKHVSATLDNGVLTVRLSKASPGKHTRVPIT
jgi:HSP20 family protein